MSILIGVFSNILVTEMTTPKGIQWGSFYATVSFYVLVVLLALLVAFHNWMNNINNRILDFANDEYCKAYVRSIGLPAAAEYYADQIRQGNLDQLQAARDELDNLLR